MVDIQYMLDIVLRSCCYSHTKSDRVFYFASYFVSDHEIAVCFDIQLNVWLSTDISKLYFPFILTLEHFHYLPSTLP